MDDETTCLKIEMADGTFYEPSGVWVRAMKMKADDFEAFVRAFQDAVKTHYENRTAPTKFGMNHSWGDSDPTDDSHEEDIAKIVRQMRTGVYEYREHYESHAELAPSVLYPVIRGALMGIAMSEADDDNDGSVVELNEDGRLVEYSASGRTDYSSLKEYLSDQDSASST